MNALFNCLKYAGMGAGLMYFWDPDLGSRRRALVRDQCLQAAKKAGRAIDVTIRDIQNRLQGTIAEVRGCMTGQDVGDDVLVHRVRSKLGRYVSHPGAIQVLARNGNIVLSGVILADEVADLVRAVRDVPGVEQLDNQLRVHSEAGNISDLQGGRTGTGEPPEFLQTNWSPAMRFVAGAAGASLILSALARRSPGSILLGVLGGIAVTRAIANPDTVDLGGSRSEQITSDNRQAQSDDDQPTCETRRDDITITPSSVDEAVDESFPASDPPSYTGTTASRSQPAGPGEGNHVRSRAVADPSSRNLMDL